MPSLFADTHNVVAILEKSDASGGFAQIINFLSGSYINYALTVSPHIYISCIKQFWNTAVVKHTGDVTRLQALVDKKKIIISEDAIHEILRLDDAEGVSVEVPNSYNSSIFGAKRTSWNEFSTAMASAVICLSKGQRFNFLRVGKGCSGVETPLFENMLQVREEDAEEESSKFLINALHLFIELNDWKDEENVFNQERISVDIDEGIELVDDQEKDVQVKGRQADTQAKIDNIDLDHTSKVLSMQEDSEVQEVVEVVNSAKLITEVVTAATTQVIPAAEPVVAAVSTPIGAAKPKVLKVVPAALVSTRKRKGVVIRDPEEELHDDTPAETQSAKDKGKGIFVEDPKPMKKKDQIAMDAEYARKLQEEEESLAQTKDAQATDVQPKDPPAKRIQYIRRYHGYKKKP
nr:hypothetical protein [Tanacetum cinerariifolium]